MDIADLWMLSCTGFGEVLKHVDLTKLIREGLERENLIPKSSNDATEHATKGEMKRNSGMTRNPTPKVLESVQNEKVVTSGSGLNAEEDAEVSSSGGKYASHERISGKTGTGSTEGLYYVSRKCKTGFFIINVLLNTNRSVIVKHFASFSLILFKLIHEIIKNLNITTSWFGHNGLSVHQLALFIGLSGWQIS